MGEDIGFYELHLKPDQKFVPNIFGLLPSYCTMTHIMRGGGGGGGKWG